MIQRNKRFTFIASFELTRHQNHLVLNARLHTVPQTRGVVGRGHVTRRGVANGDVRARLPHLRGLLAVPAPAQHPLAGREVGGDEDSVHDLTGSPIARAVPLLRPGVGFMAGVGAVGVSGAVGGARWLEGHACVFPRGQAPGTFLAHARYGIHGPCGARGRGALVHEDAADGEARAVVPEQRLLVAREREGRALETLLGQLFALGTQAVLVTTAVVISYCPSNFNAGTCHPFGARWRIWQNLGAMLTHLGDAGVCKHGVGSTPSVFPQRASCLATAVHHRCRSRGPPRVVTEAVVPVASNRHSFGIVWESRFKCSVT